MGEPNVGRDDEISAVGEADEVDRILAGYRVLDFSQYLAGAGVTRMMAELGADIIKIEIPEMGDPGRVLPW